MATTYHTSMLTLRALSAAWPLWLCVLASCSAVTSMYARGDRATAPRRVSGTTLFDWKGIIHCHSHLSHDSTGSIEDISAACSAAAIDFLVMTDHQTDASVRDGACGRIGDTLFLVGAEIRTPQGTVIAFPLTQPLRRWQSAAALVAEAERQGGLSFLCHAERTTAWDIEGFTGVEIVNLHAGAVAASKVGMLLSGLFLPLRAIMQLVCHREAELFRQWDRRLAQRHPFTPVGGNDAHANVRVFGPLGGTIGNYREVFLTLSTHILAERLDESSLLQALAAGRTYVAFDIFGEGAGFDFRAVDDGGVHVVGSTVQASPALRLMAHSPKPGRIRVLLDGAIASERESADIELCNPSPGVYRVEVRSMAGAPWLFSSSIRVIASSNVSLSSERSTGPSGR